MVKCNRSIKSYLALPIKLYKISHNAKFEKNSHEIQNMNFANYRDGYHAYQIKNHLSYKFGEILEKTKLNPFLIIILPFRLKGAYEEWKSTK